MHNSKVLQNKQEIIRYQLFVLAEYFCQTTILAHLAAIKNFIYSN